MPYKDKIKQRENARKHRLSNREHYNERNRQCKNRLYQRLHPVKIEVLTHYGNGKCACVQCGYSNEMALSIDHVDGDGANHRRATHTTAGGGKLYLWLKKHDYPDGFQTLCMNCQWIKRQINREYAWEQKHKESNLSLNQPSFFSTHTKSPEPADKPIVDDLAKLKDGSK